MEQHLPDTARSPTHRKYPLVKGIQQMAGIFQTNSAQGSFSHGATGETAISVLRNSFDY
jgi:hypothetical protein